MMDSLLQGLPNVIAYFDDILITGVSEDDLDCVMDHLKSAGLMLKQSKRVFVTESVEYLGQIIYICHRRSFMLSRKHLSLITLLNIKSFYYSTVMLNFLTLIMFCFFSIGCYRRTSNGCGLKNSQPHLHC